MDSLIICSIRALRSVFTPGIFALFFWSTLLTLLALCCFVALTAAGMDWLAAYWANPDWSPWLPLIGTLGSFALAWMLFPGIMPIIVSFFDQRIADTIERHEYPEAPVASPAHFWPEFWHDVRFTLMVLLLNIATLPVYVFFHIASPLLFYLLNGYLLGREFFVMAARRHMHVREAEQLRRAHSGTVWMIGIILTIMATIPLLNLVAPFWGIAGMVHFYQRLRKKGLVQPQGSNTLIH